MINQFEVVGIISAGTLRGIIAGQQRRETRFHQTFKGRFERSLVLKTRRALWSEGTATAFATLTNLSVVGGES